ncbi:MAG: tRNA (N6-isopentenyl adenosine(37)-C2)-methylthiotransferase MiaB [Defluviitaleaceae bacterium]|nr:tRNA (N6-isopentenyl adenosine(37)-C2)-methylthiotransferase MiaB [Defluviitaleaceae bacterium]
MGKRYEMKGQGPGNLELSVQKDYINRLQKLGNKTYNISTYGCQMNSRDSETVSGMLEEMGYTHIENREEADIVVFNTCCVRENAENRLYGNLGTLKEIKRKRKDMKIILCGCMMQQGIVLDKIRASYNFVDIIFGTFNIYRLPQLLHTSLETREQVIDIWEEHREIIEDLPSQRMFSFKAGVNIMYGCDNKCSFCIVPHVRGKERSRKMEEILSEIRALVADGVVEVMLLGQNVNSYGKNLYPEVTFAKLLREVNKIEGLERIRFMSSHPKDLSDDLIEVMRDCEKVCKQFHLPVQSGSSKLLAKMRRTYNIDQYMIIVEKLKKAVPEIMITTDLIIGFPGETDEDNEQTIELVKKVRYSNAYTFIYSPREGTEAAVMENQIPEDIAKKRFQAVVDAINPIAEEINRSQVGTVQKVLVEAEGKNGTMNGRTDGGLLVHFAGSVRQIGQIVDVKITGNKTFYLIGEQSLL